VKKTPGRVYAVGRGGVKGRAGELDREGVKGRADAGTSEP